MDDELDYRRDNLDAGSYFDDLVVVGGVILLALVIWAALSWVIYALGNKQHDITRGSCITGPIAAVVAILIGNWLLSR